MPTLIAQIFSPRWGHNDAYNFEFTRDAMTITMQTRTARCVWVEGRDPNWVGDSLDSILRNDQIYGPSILVDLLVHLWTSWRDNDLDDAQAQVELDAIITWQNSITAAKPRTDFWDQYF